MITSGRYARQSSKSDRPTRLPCSRAERILPTVANPAAVAARGGGHTSAGPTIGMGANAEYAAVAALYVLMTVSVMLPLYTRRCLLRAVLRLSVVAPRLSYKNLHVLIPLTRPDSDGLSYRGSSGPAASRWRLYGRQQMTGFLACDLMRLVRL
ncbi:hypothetical protein GH714_044128 [Hevea brasiliensis]|uniref:Uncharacterized protein n=1 Tax=Hevea brasiliensis TaxID=3981 RepID=A0A6A6K1A4_HEVBR|nr:hypothetical protein GH714_044128 [Hevea brasiliensis]